MKQVARCLSLVAVGLMLTTMAHAEWKWSGYTQLRYNQWDSDLGKNDDSAFQLRRSRVKLEGPVTDDTTFTLQADFSKVVDDDKGSGSIELKDALITRKLSDEWSLTGGYTSLPFGVEVPLSDSAAWVLERSRAADVLFPGQRDTGLYVHYRPAKSGAPQLDLGYSNGLHSWYDKDSKGSRDTSARAVVARAQWPLPNKSFAGASYMFADRTHVDASLTPNVTNNFDNQDVWNLFARYNGTKNWSGTAEYYSGHQLAGTATAAPVNQGVSGWYALAAYTVTDKPVTPFYRYDTYDGGGANDYSRHSLGVAWDRTKNERLTFQIENGSDEKAVDFTNFAVQWQVKY